ncbi:MAG: hypothetical protein KAV87_55600 [Desulfobacteraceae bacterium]|nr:hypothetical protein [Desulfobacteraceae bacterium]
MNRLQSQQFHSGPALSNNVRTIAESASEAGALEEPPRKFALDFIGDKAPFFGIWYANYERLTRDSLGGPDLPGDSLVSILILFEAYFRCRKRNKYIVLKLRYLLGNYLSRTAILYCLDKNIFDARRFALDGMHFTRSLKTYAKCLAVLLCPWLVRKMSGPKK